jgi:hypothetical protein
MPFEMTRSGRDGEIVYREGVRTIKIYWEMSGSREFDILLGTLDLRRWSAPPFEVPRARQLEMRAP